MKAFKTKTYVVIGSNSFLDKWNAQFFDKSSIEYWLSPKPLYPKQRKYINYISDYLIEMEIKQEMAQKIDQLFKATTSLSDICRFELIILFQEKSPCIITISKDNKEGNVFKRKIRRYF